MGNDQYKNIELGNLLFGHSRGRYAINREIIQPLFLDFFDRFDIDIYGNVGNNSPFYGTSRQDDEIYYSIDNSIFSISPYYWGDDERASAVPNFLYKPSGIEIRWYKYCLRDAYSNVPLTRETVEKMLADCAGAVLRG